MKKVFNGLVNGKEVPIIVVSQQDGPPHEIEIHPHDVMSEGIMDIMVVGLQYYEFSTFSILIDVIDEDGDAHHFLFDSITFQDTVEGAFEPLQVDNAYIHFNEHVGKELAKPFAFEK
jgi:hypothetical protein